MSDYTAPTLQLLPALAMRPGRQYTIKQTAELLAFSVRTVYRLIAAGELETTGRRHLLRVTEASIVAYQQRNLNGKEAS